MNESPTASISPPPPEAAPAAASWANIQLSRSPSDDNNNHALPCKVSSSSSSSSSPSSSSHEEASTGEKVARPFTPPPRRLPRPPRARPTTTTQRDEEDLEHRSGPAAGYLDVEKGREALEQRGGSSEAESTFGRDGPPRTVIIPPPMAPYAQLCYNRAEDKMVTLMVGADHVVVRDKSYSQVEATATATMTTSSRDGGATLYYLARPPAGPAKTDSGPGEGAPTGEGDPEDRDAAAANHLPEVRTKRCDASNGSGAPERDPEGDGDDDDDDDDGSEEEFDDEDELEYSKSSGLSTAFSMETIAYPSTAHSHSSFGESDSRSATRTNSSRSSGGIGGGGGDNDDEGSASTVVMYNNASRCRRSPQEIVWMDEAWLYECESVYGFRSSDRLALLHDVASGDDLDPYLYDVDYDDAMSDSCGRLLLMRSVALCKGKLKAGGAPSSGFAASSPVRASSLTSSGGASASHKQAGPGFLSGKLFEYSKL